MSPPRHLVSLRQLADDDLAYLVARARWFATAGSRTETTLAGSVVGTFFQLTSTRTRTAFASGALRLGAGLVNYGPADLQLNTGESMADTVAVLSRMLDVLVVRAPGGGAELAELAELAGKGRMAVVNAMSADEHPTQAITDLAAIGDGLGRLTELRVLYVGEGNSTAAALTLALTRFRGVELWLCTPPGYEVAGDVTALGRRQAEASAATLREVTAVTDVPAGMDVVYTTRWQTTGTRKPDPDWRTRFEPLRVDAAVMGRHPDAVFMHDLPAHRGEEVAAAVLDGPASIAFAQAEYKLYGAMAVLEWCLRGRQE